MATIVDVEALAKVVAAAALAGIGVTAIFGVVIYGGTRFVDLRREGRGFGAAVFAVATALALAAFAGSVAYGLVIMTDK